MTEREREVLAGEAGTDAYRSTVRSRLRVRLEALSEDSALLAANEPELYEDLAEIIC